ncbi:MAG TPA: type 2 isopentenyl-diphosphate Delta-isomerase [Tissierellaceae bacterium]
MRRQRKKEHVENYLKSTFKSETLFEDIYLEHNALPELKLDEINTKVEFLGKEVDYPIIINAMTGGTEFTGEINKELSILAKEFNIPMAVGSETIILCEEESCRQSFKITRENVGESGIVMANLNGHASIEDAKEAIEVIDADALQIHLNVAQELAMEEGDRDFTGILDNIENLVKNISVPIVVKEVGFGLSTDVIKRLYDVGIRYVDISGHGGTNFIEIENLRNLSLDLNELYDWGIPTALSLINSTDLYDDLTVIGSGGVRNSLDVVKALVLGADMVGISGEILSYLVHGGIDNAREYLKDLTHKVKIIMILLGVDNVEDLRKVDYKVTGRLKELL